MTLKQKLNNIKQPLVTPLGQGEASSIAELWEKFIEPRLPQCEVVLEWHRVLMEYITQPEAVFPVRGYNSEPDKIHYGKLRRGFLTLTDDKYSFFYTDNFHAAYYLKMAIDGYIPTVQELLSTYQQREFPSRFGPDTTEERKLMAIPKGKDPGFQTSGYLIAHIFDAGKSFYENGTALSLKRHILDVYFPRGERSDWIQREDNTGKFYLRELHVAPEAKKYMVAAFLRFVHPFNYFLMPKKSCCSMDLSGDRQLLNFVKYKLRKMYGTSYDEFLALIMPENTFITEARDVELQGYRYGELLENAKSERIALNQGIHLYKTSHKLDLETRIREIANSVYRGLDFIESAGYSSKAIGTRRDYILGIKKAHEALQWNTESGPCALGTSIENVKAYIQENINKLISNSGLNNYNYILGFKSYLRFLTDSNIAHGVGHTNDADEIIAKAICVRLEKEIARMRIADIIDTLASGYTNYKEKKASLQSVLSANLRKKGVFLPSRERGIIEFSDEYWESDKIRKIRNKIGNIPKKLRFEWVLEQLT